MTAYCPSCGATCDLPIASLEAGGALITCKLCGNEWIGPRSPESRAGRFGSSGANPDTQPLMVAARQAREAFMAQRRQRQKRVAAWAGLILVALSPLLGALAFPERVVAAAPATIAFYDWFNREVNIYGLDIRRLRVEHLMVDGHPELSVTGELANISNVVRKVPWLRFGLRDEGYAEIYTWQLDVGAQPLKPGESRRFATRLPAPPKNARKLEIRFARTDEIGSNTLP